MESRGGGGSDPPLRGFRVGYAALVTPAPLSDTYQSWTGTST
jgi:hypothetical protein